MWVALKKEILDRARSVFGVESIVRFLGGHPMAGKEHGGIENADAKLFLNAAWLIVKQPGQDAEHGRIKFFRELLEKIGAKVINLEAEKHDHLCAWVSQVPQMISTALAATLVEEFADNPDLHAIGGRALREMTRISSSPYSMWRDIAYTNEKNIGKALHQLEQRIAHIRENLRTPELRDESNGRTSSNWATRKRV